MADFAAVQESDLEDGNQPSEGLTGSGVGSLSKNTYQPVNDNDLAPAGPTVSPAFRGFRGGIPNIPTAAAQRFQGGDAISRIFGAGVKKFAEGYSNSFNAMTDADKQMLVENGYGQYSGPGGLLQHAADTFNSGLALAVDGFFALGPAISEGVGGIEGQIARETGAPEDVAKSAEREGSFIGQALQSDVGAMHAASMIDAAKANAAVPGIYGHAYRLDRMEDGSAALMPLGRLPTEGAEADAQAAAAADALHLPPSATKTIGDTYKQTGRSPAEVYLDAKTNNGGVLSDIVAGKVPSVYQGPARALTPEEIESAKTAVSPEGGAAAPAAGGTETPPVSPSAPTGISKIGKSIEQKAIDAGITDGFLQTAGYDVKTVKGQTALVSDIITNNPDRMNAIVNGEEALPKSIDPSMFVTGVEEYIKQTKDWDLASRLANSPVVTRTSEAGQTMRFAQEREPDSAAAKLAELKQAQVKAAGGAAEVAKKQTQAKAALKEGSNGVFLPKEDMRWEKFLDEIAC